MGLVTLALQDNLIIASPVLIRCTFTKIDAELVRSLDIINSTDNVCWGIKFLRGYLLFKITFRM